MQLVIFDIDGTLTQSNDLDNDAFLQTLFDVFGFVEVSNDWMSYSHVTDACILKEVCQHFLNRIPSPKEYDISSWKPEPGLFLYAASKMGFSPEHCVVIEDSDVGIQAARLAGIYALKYSHQEEGKEKSNVFSNMELLSKQLDKIYAMKCDRSAYDL